MADTEKEQLLTISHAATRLGVSAGTLRGWADKGLIAHVKLPSGYRRFTMAEVERMRREMGLEKVHTERRDRLNPNMPTHTTPPENGHWYGARGKVEFICGHCRTKQDDWPEVMRYRPELDHGGAQRQKHFGWAKLGWLTFWDCPKCGRATYYAVDEEQVHRWSASVGPWQSH